jgi:BCD family chlorophyll transporter-like MFS transporter
LTAFLAWDDYLFSLSLPGANMFIKRLQLGLIHVAVAMTLVPINSTLNRVMIKELAISATLVAVLASLPYLFSPIQVLIGSFADRHPLLGLRRSPYILAGLGLCVLGVVFSPYTAFSMQSNRWLGILFGVLTFGAWGMGYNLASVSYLSLASEISGEKGRGRTIAIMWFMMITSIIVTAIGLSHMVDPYTPEALIRAFLMIGLTALFLGLAGLIRLESSSAEMIGRNSESHSWGRLLGAVLENRQATTFFWYLIILLAAILGQDILLEPFAAEAFGMSVRETTRITSIWGTCVLAALLVAGVVENKIGKRMVARLGAWGALIGFIMITISGIITSLHTFYGGVLLLGVGTGLATVSNLSLMLDMTTASNVGLFIGAWGMANAISRLIGTILGGVLRDVVTQLAQNPISGYVVVFAIEAAMLVVSLLILRRINVQAFLRGAEQLDMIERAAIASEG